MKTATLANQTRTTIVLNLPYDVVPELATRGVVGTREHNGESGDRTVRAHRKRISGSLTLLPKGTPGDMLRGLPASVLEAPDVKRALNAWPPKIAAKVLDTEAREQDDKERAEAAAKDEKRQQTDATLAATKRDKLAKAAGALVEAKPSAATATKTDSGTQTTGRGARPVSKE